MSIDITSLSAKELDALINQAKKRKTTLSKRKPIAAVRKKLTRSGQGRGLHDRRTVRRRAAPKPRRRVPPRPAQDAPRATSSARSRRSTAIPATPAKPGPAAASSRAGWPRIPRPGPQAGRVPDQVIRGNPEFRQNAGLSAGVSLPARAVAAPSQVPPARQQQVAEQQPAISASRIFSTASSASWPATTSCCWISVSSPRRLALPGTSMMMPGTRMMAPGRFHQRA